MNAVKEINLQWNNRISAGYTEGEEASTTAQVIYLGGICGEYRGYMKAKVNNLHSIGQVL